MTKYERARVLGTRALQISLVYSYTTFHVVAMWSLLYNTNHAWFIWICIISVIIVAIYNIYICLNIIWWNLISEPILATITHTHKQLVSSNIYWLSLENYDYRYVFMMYSNTGWLYLIYTSCNRTFCDDWLSWWSF